MEGERNKIDMVHTAPGGGRTPVGAAPPFLPLPPVGTYKTKYVSV